MEKEALLVINELWAKLSATERFIVYGGGLVIVGWLIGLILATVNLCAGINSAFCPASLNINYFTGGNAGAFAILGLVAGVAAVVILYLKNAPNMSIAWPMPVGQILLYVSVATLALTVLTVLFQVTRGLDGAPLMMWVADVVFVAGGALQAWGAYQGYLANKAA
jgi:hypothetical protein